MLAALGNRFLLMRMPDANVEEFGKAALQHGAHEQEMRLALSGALTGLVASADPARVNRQLTDVERDNLIRLAAYTASARTAVARDGLDKQVLYLPQVEGPGQP